MSGATAATYIAAATLAIAAGSTAMSVSQANAANKNAKNASISSQNEANYRAEQGRIAAGNERASSQRSAEEARRQTGLKQSRLQALSAAGGAGALDPSVVDLIGGLEGEGEYNAMSALFEGETRAQSLEQGADLAQFQAKTNKPVSGYGATTAALDGASSFFDKYSDYNSKGYFGSSATKSTDNLGSITTSAASTTPKSPVFK